MMRLCKKILISFMVTGLILFLSACGADNTTLSVVVDPSYPPFVYEDNGTVKGIEIDLLQEIADEMDRTLTIDIASSRQSVIEQVQNSDYDLGVAKMAVTGEVIDDVWFTAPYTSIMQVVITTQDSQIQNVADLSDQTIGVIENSTSSIMVQENDQNAEIISFPSHEKALEALLEQQVDALVMDSEPARRLVPENEQITILEQLYHQDDYAFVIEQDNIDFMIEVNDAITQLNVNHVIEEIVESYR